jgi:hypothetical protein
MDNVTVVDWLLQYHQLVNSGFVSLSEVIILDFCRAALTGFASMQLYFVIA